MKHSWKLRLPAMPKLVPMSAPLEDSERGTLESTYSVRSLAPVLVSTLPWRGGGGELGRGALETAVERLTFDLMCQSKVWEFTGSRW